jgi:hypothetical protein
LNTVFLLKKTITIRHISVDVRFAEKVKVTVEKNVVFIFQPTTIYIVTIVVGLALPCGGL